MPTNGLSTTPLRVKLLAGEQKATEFLSHRHISPLGFRQDMVQGMVNQLLAEAASQAELPASEGGVGSRKMA